MELSVIIPTGNDPSGLEATLASLVSQVDGGAHEVIVCNDGAYRPVADVCARFGVRCIDISPNAGSYNARNRGIEMAKGKLLAFLDAGVEVCADWIGRATEEAAESDYIAGEIRHPHVPPASGAVLYQILYGFPRDYFEKLHFGPTANLVVSRRVVEGVGGFDGRLRSGGDKEFGERVFQDGRFRQTYSSTRYVIHGFRSLDGLVKKQRRTTMGLRQLKALLPDRYAKEVPKGLALARLLLPPKALWLAIPILRRGLPAGEPRSEMLKDAPPTACVSAYFISYCLRLTSFLALCQPYKNPDSFEWGAGNAMKP